MHDKQVKLQGKWLVEEGVRGADGEPVTVLKYAVEMAIHAGPLRALGLIEPLLDQGIVEDVPASLAAIKRAAEGVAPPVQDAAGPLAARQIETFDELRAELTTLFGDAMVMPTRGELLERGRYAPVASGPFMVGVVSYGAVGPHTWPCGLRCDAWLRPWPHHLQLLRTAERLRCHTAQCTLPCCWWLNHFHSYDG